MKKLSLMIGVALLPFLCFSQKPTPQKPAPQEHPPFITFEYMHVKPGNDQAYLQVENFWKHIHEARKKKGAILGWSVWEVAAPYNMEAPYQYVVVTVYPHFADILHSLEDFSGGMDLHQIFPGASDDSLRKMMTLTRTSRDLIRRDIFSAETHVGNTNANNPNYMMVTYGKVTPEKEQSFETYMKNHWKPMAEKIVKGGFAKFWWYGGLMFGAGTNSHYNVVGVVLWDSDNFFDNVPPFDQYRKEDPAAFEGYKWRTTSHRELLRKVVSLDSGGK